MTVLDDFFRGPADALAHPRLRDWKRRLTQPGVSAALELYRPSTALGLTQTEMNLHFTENGNPQPLETIDWDDDLNTGLIQLGVRAVNIDQEAERFALGLRASLRKAEREFGDGFFNAVLLEFIKDSDLTSYLQIAEVLKHTYGNRPCHDGKSYGSCREMIADAIGGRARELAGPLSYPEEEAKRILVDALARFIDERFSVSNRRRLGLL